MNKRFTKIKDISSIGFADVIGSVIAASFWFFLATLINPETYGEITYLISIASIASSIALFGAAQSLLVYSAKDVKIHSTLYTINLIVGVISAVIVALIVKDFSVSLLVIGYLVFAIAYSDILGKRYFKTYIKYILIQKILMIIFSLSFFFIYGEQGIILGMAISLFVGIGRIIQGYRETKIDFKLFKEKLNFISFNYVHSLVGALHGSLDKIIIGPLFGFTLLGNYSLGLQFFGLLVILPMIVGKYLIPLESNGIENKKIKKIIILISIVLAILGVLVGPEIITWLFPKFLGVELFIRIVSLGIIPQTVIINNRSTFLANEKANYFLVVGIIRLVILTSTIIILGGIYGIEGIAVGVILSLTVAAIYSIIMTKKMSMDSKK
jgi:O-antigen/teichoic acid export membrane protein